MYMFCGCYEAATVYISNEGLAKEKMRPLSNSELENIFTEVPATDLLKKARRAVNIYIQLGWACVSFYVFND